MTQRSKPRHYRRRRSAQQWEEMMERYERSGMSVAEFCAKEGVVLSTFHRWRAQLRGERALGATADSCRGSTVCRVAQWPHRGGRLRH